MSTALLIVDMLNDFVLKGAPLEVPNARAIVPALKRQLSEARVQGMHVIYLCDAHAVDDPEFEKMGWPPHAIKGTHGASIVDDLAPQSAEPVVLKSTYSGFYATNLDAILKELNVQELVLAGCVTNICILYTAADAVMRGYKVRVPVSLVADLDARDGEFALEQMEKVLGVEVVAPGP